MVWSSTGDSWEFPIINMYAFCRRRPDTTKSKVRRGAVRKRSCEQDSPSPSQSMNGMRCFVLKCQTSLNTWHASWAKHDSKVQHIPEAAHIILISSWIYNTLSLGSSQWVWYFRFECNKYYCFPKVIKLTMRSELVVNVGRPKTNVSDVVGFVCGHHAPGVECSFLLFVYA